jgi:hypothetical protein
VGVVHKTKGDPGLPPDPPRVRKFPGRPSDDPSRQRVRELVDAGFLSPSSAEAYTADPERDRLPRKQAS